LPINTHLVKWIDSQSIKLKLFTQVYPFTLLALSLFLLVFFIFVTKIPKTTHSMIYLRDITPSLA